MARKATSSSSGSSASLGRAETNQSILGSTPVKRPASPEPRKRDDSRPNEYSQNHKRPRPSSPVRGDREREIRWEGPPRRRFSPPAWDRDDRGRAPLPPPRTQEREEEKPRGTGIPPVISWFIGELPTPASFDGMFIYS